MVRVLLGFIWNFFLLRLFKFLINIINLKGILSVWVNLDSCCLVNCNDVVFVFMVVIFKFGGFLG